MQASNALFCQLVERTRWLLLCSAAAAVVLKEGTWMFNPCLRSSQGYKYKNGIERQQLRKPCRDNSSGPRKPRQHFSYPWRFFESKISWRAAD
eukprot:2631193-Amphidinium_carterae.1